MTPPIGETAETETGSLGQNRRNSTEKDTSPKTNGFFVRFVGRRRLTDAFLKSLAFYLTLPAQPLLLLVARSKRGSWQETLMDLYSIERPLSFYFSFLNPLSIWQPQTEEDSEAVRRILSRGGRELKVKISTAKRPLRCVCISDTHMRHDKLPDLPEGDVLIHTGDCTNFGSLAEVVEFASWMGRLNFPHKILVPGNHDMILDPPYYADYWSDWSLEKEDCAVAFSALETSGVKVLKEEGVTIEGVSVFGTPWVVNGNPWETAFNVPQTQAASLWDKIPSDTQILLTHMPPFGMKDRDVFGVNAGCPDLANAVMKRVKPAAHIFGHEHADSGVFVNGGTAFVNAASVSDFYQPRSPVVMLVEGD
uniref:Calcineurin-like phosphoesterase domain-containing protein n=1 Tax=Chromera velia CCMP2878 TaxID=1169474 RepID=A0A0G4F160_9ALVE|eukprot:Cvel_14464.t1-p1 / transcript=Cvel_14464.t1 / gene=Cvel_14464 / organism=Chromera_velia_CCMP2878 / gene_product=Metallophosphoesterase MPPED2, putative / transcript_product=Metallophosphoesterase MPPED2, putative / location=Cvel_scaffold1030:11035-14186(-) / protein_length=363 / sequence_SO=supercontig / SO=protein_coding / is_pseudo=false